jgi:hypothetical protein
MAGAIRGSFVWATGATVYRPSVGKRDALGLCSHRFRGRSRAFLSAHGPTVGAVFGQRQAAVIERERGSVFELERAVAASADARRLFEDSAHQVQGGHDPAPSVATAEGSLNRRHGFLDRPHGLPIGRGRGSVGHGRTRPQADPQSSSDTPCKWRRPTVASGADANGRMSSAPMSRHFLMNAGSTATRPTACSMAPAAAVA